MFLNSRKKHFKRLERKSGVFLRRSTVHKGAEECYEGKYRSFEINGLKRREIRFREGIRATIK